MKALLVIAALVAAPDLGAAPKLLQPGDVALISTLAIAQCFITPPTPIFGVSTLPQRKRRSTSQRISAPSFTRKGTRSADTTPAGNSCSPTSQRRMPFH